MSLAVAILAGGFATRMLPITEKIPKSLIVVGGDFFINHQLRYLSQQGISKIVLCIGHLGEQIKAVVGDGRAYGLKVSYSWDGHSLLGTGGALKQALPLLGETFFILYGDSYLPIDFAGVEKKFYENNKPALMTVIKNNNRWDKSNVLFENNLITEYNKDQPTATMEYIDYGLSILSASVFDNFNPRFPLKQDTDRLSNTESTKPFSSSFELTELYHELSLRKELIGYEVFKRFYEIGSVEGLRELMNQFKETP
jgi:NDP-sugar pyrophosphorylase family protein